MAHMAKFLPYNKDGKLSSTSRTHIESLAWWWALELPKQGRQADRSLGLSSQPCQTTVQVPG